MKLAEQIKNTSITEWVLILFVGLMLINPILDAETIAEKAVFVIAYVVFFWILPLLSRKVLKLHKRGPIPWYGSPVVIIFGLAACILVWVRLS
jgi:uncharacterized membrane protein YcaP (DUF421 family)